VRRSKVARRTTTKERTFITHLNNSKWSKDEIGFNLDGSKMKKKQIQQANKAVPAKKKGSKFDEKQEKLIETVESTI
jgi:hypothetical protein